MKKRSFLLILPVLLLAVFIFLSFQKDDSKDSFDQTVKVTLRAIGNKLLLASKDSTSLILPVKKVKENHYKLEFQKQLAITPDSLVTIANASLKKAKLPKRYIVEVVNCSNNEVSYSFKISAFSEKDIVPCLGRNLPADCYIIHVFFLEKTSFFDSAAFPILVTIFTLLVLIFLLKKKRPQTTEIEPNNFVKIGAYKFYKDQNKLIRDTTEIKLSTKECELMQMFSAHQNEIIKRETLIKHIWEDNGVFVGRSLDTFISKLRKKFKDDNTINIVNVHGVGYKLEVG
ncbi:winged helix-turn-helix domain-containing protein [Seonamhaeicola marinus]|uniref:Winged helix-turn-helix transcriptional regulator n=1 Tax=Seonamhaeicola marinus TaxID=1912246 RepID=A0A5D0HRQ5_9FLAO|nr:winged helix-turn-helix domain-containing protein [Seonamhaeicola marinus]TYA74014.1 winged helix-turn-helix transcriptional regulator [Seonamhaeicola marinus]